MICLTDLLTDVSIFLMLKDIGRIAPIMGGLGTQVVMNGGSTYFVRETPEKILCKVPQIFVDRQNEVCYNEDNKGEMPIY